MRRFDGWTTGNHVPIRICSSKNATFQTCMNGFYLRLFAVKLFINAFMIFKISESIFGFQPG
jgi:hypothetical protein